MENKLYSSEIPMGLGMALAKNPPAMNYFTSLPQNEQRQIIDRTHSIQSKAEMRSFVASLGGGNLQ